MGNGQLTVGTNEIRGGGGCGTQYRYALCNTVLAGDFLLDAEVTVVSAQEFRAGVVYGWQGPQKYYIFHLNDYENGVIQLIAFDIAQSPCERVVVSKQFDSQRDRAYHVRVAVSGTRHTVYIDGNPEIDVTDTGYAGGQIGLAASFNGYGRFDNLRVEGAPTHLPPTQSVDWVESSPASHPSARAHSAIAYHPANGLVLFGGEDVGNETWTWDGVNWTRHDVPGPSARHAHAMVYAEACNVVALFGGTNGNDELWLWDGASWRRVYPTPGGPWPTARGGHGMAYDPDRERVVMFGGSPGDSGTWEWNCRDQAWTRFDVTGPWPGLDALSMAWHPHSGTVVFGGSGPSGLTNETWTWDGAGWNLVATSSGAAKPSPRAWTPMAYDARRGSLVMFGGNPDNVGTALNETWEWTGASWRLLFANDPLRTPPQRSRSMIAYDPQRQVTTVFGGFGQGNVNPTPFDDTWELRNYVPTQCVVLDFEQNAPFFVGQPLFIRVPFGSTPRIDPDYLYPNYTSLRTVLNSAVPVRSYDEFKTEVLAQTIAEYDGFRIEITLSDYECSAPQANHSRVYFGGPRSDFMLGQTEWYDTCNVNKADTAIVFLGTAWLSGSDPNNYNRVVSEMAASTAHEVGHLLGLFHTSPVTEQQLMYHLVYDTTRVFVGKPLCIDWQPCLLGVCVPCIPDVSGTQNDRVALAHSVSAFPWMLSRLGDPGSRDRICDKRVVNGAFAPSIMTYDVHAVITAPPDVGRSYSLGDVPAGESRTIRAVVSPGEQMTFVGSSVSGGGAARGIETSPDIVAYFGTPDSTQVSKLDPAHFGLTTDFSTEAVLSYEAVLLKLNGDTFELVGHADGGASSASDFNQDGRIDGLDLARLVGCLSGPADAPSKNCTAPDLNMDGHIDLADIAQFITTHSAYPH